MGFFDNLMNGEYNDKINSAVVDRMKRNFQMSTDSGLQQWWDEHQYSYDIPDEIKEAAQKEMRRRGLM